LNGLNLGLGFRISDYSVDYAYQPFGDLGDVHRLTVSLPFGRSVSEEQNLLAKLEKQVKDKQRNIFKNLVGEGDVWLAKGNFEKAAAIYAHAFGVNPDDAALKKKIRDTETLFKKQQAAEKFERGQKAFDERDYLTALVEFSKALELNPGMTAAKRLAEAANQKMSSEKLSGETNKNKQLIEQYFQQGLLSLQKSKYAQALETWKKILALDPNNSRVSQYLRITRTKLDELTQDLLKLADRDWENGQSLEAVKKWRHVLELQPEQAQASARLSAHKAVLQELMDENYRLGIEQYIQNNLPAAMAYWQNVLVIDPGNAKALKHLEHAGNKQQELEAIK
ncbi:MAG: hypothetical protein HGA76_04405, partial [Candidatus Firestonebacteria bacterium]|nr:hypothetical protein [Candidatus Firestonebacteria bacterium]